MSSLETNRSAPSRLWFPEYAGAPFGELNLVRADYFVPDEGNTSSQSRLTAPTSPVLDVMGPHIVKEAWADAGWVKELVGTDNSKLLEPLLPCTNIEEPILRSIWRAQQAPDKESAWFALKPPTYELKKGDALIRGMGGVLVCSQLAGFANAKHDVSGNALQRYVKRHKHPEKVYAAVANVAVRPKDQGQGVGAALLYASLGLFRPNQHPTTYIAGRNYYLFDKLGELGFHLTGSHFREDLIEGHPFEELRLQADSVEAVKDRLVTYFPWLSQAVSTPKLGRFDIY